MKGFVGSLFVLLAFGLFSLFVPQTAHAYGGPGSVISGIGALLALVGVVIAAIFGFLWFPIKRLISHMTKGEKGSEEEEAG
ncbi:MAG: hypothetical protein R6V13_03215 [Anaerolineae bacterium]